MPSSRKGAQQKSPEEIKPPFKKLPTYKIRTKPLDTKSRKMVASCPWKHTAWQNALYLPGSPSPRQPGERTRPRLQWPGHRGLLPGCKSVSLCGSINKNNKQKEKGESK
jgi:hypothetical protein